MNQRALLTHEAQAKERRAYLFGSCSKSTASLSCSIIAMSVSWSLDELILQHETKHENENDPRARILPYILQSKLTKIHLTHKNDSDQFDIIMTCEYAAGQAAGKQWKRAPGLWEPSFVVKQLIQSLSAHQRPSAHLYNPASGRAGWFPLCFPEPQGTHRCARLWRAALLPDFSTPGQPAWLSFMTFTQHGISVWDGSSQSKVQIKIICST